MDADADADGTVDGQMVRDSALQFESSRRQLAGSPIPIVIREANTEDK